MNISINARKYFIGIAYIFGISLVLINIYGKTQSIRHPDLLSFDKYGGEFIPIEIASHNFNSINSHSVYLNRKEALEKVREVLQIENEHNKIIAIQKLVTASMVHFYPVNKPYLSDYFHVPLYENFILYFGARLYEITGLKPLSVFRPYEYLNGKKSWERGAAMCGEISSVVMYLLDKAGIENGKAGLDGHVIALAQASNGEKYIIDADYGFTLKGSLSDIANYHTDDVRKISGSSHLSNIYGPEGNIEFWTGDRGYRPKGYWFERISYFLKWVIPLMLIMLPFYLSKSNK